MISVIVPVYQSEVFLHDCIDSVLGQSFEDWELILIDDGSRDGSGVICDEYAEKDKRIHVIHQENAGVSEARNNGLSVAVGDYIAFLDSDDRFEPDMLKILMNLIEKNDADSAACGHINEYPGGRREIKQISLNPGVYEAEDVMTSIVRPLLRDRVEGTLFEGFLVRYLYNAGIIKDNGLKFAGAYLEDELFVIEYFCLAGRLAVTDKTPYIYYQNPKSVTRTYMKDFYSVFARSMELKTGLVEKYKITGINGWQEHSGWAGLLMAVANEFAAGSEGGFFPKRRKLKELCDLPLFENAKRKLTPQGVVGNKSYVVKLLTARSYTLLTVLYMVKNRKRAD